MDANNLKRTDSEDILPSRVNILALPRFQLVEAVLVEHCAVLKEEKIYNLTNLLEYIDQHQVANKCKPKRNYSLKFINMIKPKKSYVEILNHKITNSVTNYERSKKSKKTVSKESSLKFSDHTDFLTDGEVIFEAPSSKSLSGESSDMSTESTINSIDNDVILETPSSKQISEDPSEKFSDNTAMLIDDGVMLETPSSKLVSEKLGKEFSDNTANLSDDAKNLETPSERGDSTSEMESACSVDETLTMKNELNKERKKRFESSLQNITEENQSELMDDLLLNWENIPKPPDEGTESDWKTNIKTLHDVDGRLLKIPTKILNYYISLMYGVLGNINLHDIFQKELQDDTYYSNPHISIAYHIWDQYFKYAGVTMRYLQKYVHNMMYQCETRHQGDPVLEKFENKIPIAMMHCSLSLNTWKKCLEETIEISKDFLSLKKFSLSPAEQNHQLRLKYHRKIRSIKRFMKTQKLFRLKVIKYTRY